MDVTNLSRVLLPKGGSVALGLERVRADRAEAGSRMASPKKIREIMATVSIPVMAKCPLDILRRRKFCRSSGR